jgi:hypothetical protein
MKRLRRAAALPFQAVAGVMAFVTLGGILMTASVYALVILISGDS